MSQATMTSAVHPGSVLGPNRLFAAGQHAGHAGHVAAYGPLRVDALGTVFIERLQESGLAGRGGAGFATWRKFAAHGRDRPVVVANGAEGEPLSCKDATLLAHAPHLVIDGLLVAGAVLSAKRLVLYAGAGSLPALASALADRPDAGAVRLVEAPDTFLAGETSAVANVLAGGPPIPLDRVTASRTRPTLVQNVETLAQVALIARYGPAWFRSAGTASDPGTRLVTVSGDVPSSQVLEVAGGAAVGDVLHVAGVGSGVSAVLVGGYHGQWVRSASAPVTPGAGVLMVLGSGRCGLVATAQITAYLAAQSARQCGPCRFGLPALADAMGRLADRDPDPGLPAELASLGALVSGRGACHHPDGTVRLVASALDAFGAETLRHLAGTCVEDES
ncbi:NADH-ubiquinone oxidoreductase-F iron-sulfur binding region domain-containing protein [Specibacter cremeus]|uniref:NADH-ubiquinone oxidoreductase-F iron-sulfur binding region domain-containing protein n=1 Tax=Specibacter cremeus TaxID=1629051 RepID=UPI000F76BDF3|nr:NADH-ubiquinone oxidoreductase-F iron-sulfur binding region domain-containing protein [Specibacter cremeus]